MIFQKRDLTINLVLLKTRVMLSLRHIKDSCQCFSHIKLGPLFTYDSLEAFGAPSKAAVLVLTLMRLFPVKILEWLFANIRSKRLDLMRGVAQLSRNVAKDLVNEKKAALLAGQQLKDMLSMCIQANVGQSSRGQLSEEEMYSQLQYEFILLIFRCCRDSYHSFAQVTASSWP
jgi:hypothetical protein